MTERQSPQTLAEDPVETRLRMALQAQATRDVPEQRPVPPIDWSGVAASPVGRPWPRWIVPLAAAAAVVAITAGLVVAQTWGKTGAQAPAATPSVSSTTTSADPTKSSAPGLSPAQMPGVQLALPAGWTTKPVSPEPTDPVVGARLCRGGDDCPITIVALDPTAMRFDYSGTTPFESTPALCGGSDAGRAILKEAKEATFGGRAADYRHWQVTCADGRQYEVAKYLVPSPEAYLVWSEKADSATRAVLADLAAQSRLPAARPGGLRLYDQGRVRSVTQVPGGWSIELQRAVGGNVNEWTWPSTTTYRYTIPSTLLPSATTGFKPETSLLTMVSIETDGWHVTALRFPGG